ncbi:tRNA (cytosine(38)-C(5))-methyltransferase isoform X8 [Arvicanthis niloticus]|uniref:tRNA (cytosine(38)-C(5))-methyltransferase isoform X8 n=1 Tax=Arvicanthis niloticus TaxID=61156 RepID=UPI001486F42F|nr:tRNA (cytosine(38)-C(5))-methyltransferase isoform X5 [Arvicanthis niloticus]
MEPLRVLELYSGIGGMHHALRESCIPAHVVAAIDVNTVANEVYKHNFPHTHLLAKTIEGISLEEFDKLSFNMILMSPPCQPFTRIGLQGDMTDPRTNSFLYLLDILPRLQKLPKYILLENVKGFEVSSTRGLLIETLEACGFQYQEFLLSPSSLETPEEIDRKRQQDSDLSVQMLKDFLEDDDTDQYLLPPKLLLRYALLLDIVKPTSRRSMCFTKGYGSYIEGTGSVLQTAEDVQIEDIYKSLADLPPDEKIAKLSMLKLRYFTPREIANLQGFPPEFGFPEKTTVKQRYRLLGNSLNVHVVAKLLTVCVNDLEVPLTLDSNSKILS